MMLSSTLSKMQQHDAGEPESNPSTPRTSHPSSPQRYWQRKERAYWGMEGAKAVGKEVKFERLRCRNGCGSWHIRLSLKIWLDEPPRQSAAVSRNRQRFLGWAVLNRDT